MKYLFIIPFFLTIIIMLTLDSFNKKSCKDSNGISKQLTIEPGDYKGLWNSKTINRTFENLPISATIKEVGRGKFEGLFFISNNLTSCCNSGESDGTISFTIEKGVINDFIYNDIIPNCNGSFTGNGKIALKNLILVHIQGKDCDGNHTGTITLSK